MEEAAPETDDIAEPAGTALRCGVSVGQAAGVLSGEGAAMSVPAAAVTAGAVFAQWLSTGAGPVELTAEEQAHADAINAHSHDS